MAFWKVFSRRAGVAATAAASLLLFSRAAWAQGCVMCYTSASALNKNGAHALDKAIITLWIPPALIFVGIFAYIYRRRRAWRNSASEDLLSERETPALLHAPSRTRA